MSLECVCSECEPYLVGSDESAVDSSNCGALNDVAVGES